MVVALLGRFKGETGENYHLLCIVDVTSHGTQKMDRQNGQHLSSNGNSKWPVLS